MNHLERAAPVLGLAVMYCSLVACGSDDATVTNDDLGVAGAAGSTGTPAGSSPFAPPPEPGAGGFWVTVSGEDLALLGYDWTPSSRASGDPPAFVDGWALSFEHVIITVDHLQLRADPDRDEANPLDLGEIVASADGPWAVDVAVGGDVIGKSGSPDERTIPIAAFPAQTDGSVFDPASRYAFSYDLVAAAEQAHLTNLDEAGRALYTQAQQRGWSMILAGTARYRGPAPAADAVHAQIPEQVEFTLGLHNPSRYINCRNTDLQAVGDEFPRGVQANANAATTIQITLHTDHLFWDTLNVEGTPLHFDPIAAQASTYGTPSAPGVVTSDDLARVDITALTTKSGEPLPWRSVVPDYAAPAGQMSYAANGTSFDTVNGFAAYLAYSAASGGHMNADGECEIQNEFVP